MKKQTAAKGKTESKRSTTKNKQPMKTGATKTESKTALAVVQQKNYIMVSPSEIIVDETKNLREEYGEINELMESIVQNGLRNPLKAYMKDGRIILREGFRRMRAVNLALKAGKKIERVPVILDERHLSEEERTLEFLINNDGKPFTMLEQSEVVKQLLKHGLKTTEVVTRTGKARGYIENLIMLGSVPTKIREYIKANKISAHAVIQILQAIKGDEAKLIAAVEEAINAAKAAGKEKATPKHVKTEKVKAQSFGKFYKWLEEIVDTISGRKATKKDKEKVVADMLVFFENGQRAKDVAERYFIDKSIKEEAPAKEDGKKELPKAEPKKATTKKAQMKKGAAKVAAKKAPKKAAKRK